MIRFTINFFIFSLVVGLLPVLAGYFGMAGLLLPKFWYMYLFFMLLTYVVCSMVILGQKKEGNLGAQLFLIATVVKLLACMTFALIYVQYVPVKASRFMLGFFYLYFLNTAFEVYTLLSNLRVQNKK